MVTSKVESVVVWAVTENADDINESRKVIVRTTNVRLKISTGLLGTLIL
jgi:hypothetical protein